MARDSEVSRRTVMKITGATAATALVAGCGGDDGDGGNGDDNGDDQEALEPGEEIDFSAQTSHWEGLAPSDIEGEQNPTLYLTEGEEYTVGWSEGDGSEHNIEIRDSDDEVVEDLSTETSSEGGDDQQLTFTASEEMAVYRCQPHSGMEGDIELV